MSGYNTDSTGKLEKEKPLLVTLNDALKKLNKSLKALKLKLGQEPGNETSGPGEEEAANVAAQKAATMQTYSDFYKEFKQCLVVGENENPSESQDQKGEVRKKVVSDNHFVTTLSNCFQNNEYKDTDVKPFFNAVLAASLNINAKKLGPEKFEGKTYNPSNEDNNINHELLLVIINSLVPNIIFKKSIDESFEAILTQLVKLINNNSSELMKQIQKIYTTGEEEESAFSLFDGGSKPKSKSKSSSSKSSSKSKSKNKTKKNHHSNSKSNKNKTPKIIMNE